MIYSAAEAATSASHVPSWIEKTHDADDRHESYCDIVNEKHKTESETNAAVWSRAPGEGRQAGLDLRLFCRP